MISTDCAINAMEAITDIEHHGPYIGAYNYIYSTSKIMKYKVLLQICVFYFSDPFVWYLTLKNMTYDKITHRVTANISWTVPFNTSHIKNYAVAWEVVNNDSNNRNSAGYENHITTQMYHVISLAPNKEYQVSVCKDLYPVLKEFYNLKYITWYVLQSVGNQSSIIEGIWMIPLSAKILYLSTTSSIFTLSLLCLFYKATVLQLNFELLDFQVVAVFNNKKGDIESSFGSSMSEKLILNTSWYKSMPETPRTGMSRGQ